MTILNHLRLCCLDTDGCFLAFTLRLPKTDVVEQLVNVLLNFLLPFLRTPYLNALANKPLDDEGCLVFLPAQPVKHIDKQDVEFLLQSGLADFDNGISVVSGNFITGDAFFGSGVNNLPTHTFAEFLAGTLLHGDVVFCVFINLTLCGYSVQAKYSFLLTHAHLPPASVASK
jgi:hypothetical protein